MASEGVYTPLESLLLFQCLEVYGAREHAFGQISDLLKSNGALQDGKTYDPTRLSATGLQKLYRRTLQAEIARDARSDALDSGVGSPSKKMRMQSPPLPTLDELLEHASQIPLLVEQLADSYEAHMIADIREDERNIEALVKELENAKGAEEVPTLQEQENTTASKNAKVASESLLAKQPGLHPPQPVSVSETPKPVETPILPPISRPQVTTANAASSPTISPRSEARPEGLSITDVLNSQDVPPVVSSPRLPHSRSRSGSQVAPLVPQRSGSSGSHGPSPLQPTQAPPIEWQASWQPPPQPPTQYQQHPGAANPQYQYPQSQYPQPAPRGPFQPPQSAPYQTVPSNTIQHPHSHVLPPLRTAQGASAVPSSTHADIAGQQQERQYRPAMSQEQKHNPGSGSPLQPAQAQYGPGFQQAFSPSRPHVPSQWPQNMVPPPQYMQQYSPNPMPQSGHFAPPATSHMAQTAMPQTAMPQTAQSPLAPPDHRGYNSPYHGGPPQRPLVPSGTPVSAASRLRQSLPQTPASHESRPQVAGSSTRWTPVPMGTGTPRNRVPLPPPEREPLSPVAKPAKKPEPRKSLSTPIAKEKAASKPKEAQVPQSKEASTAKTKDAQLPKAKETPTPKSKDVLGARPKSLAKPKMLGRPPSRPRAGSATSSAVPASVRSQSVMSYTDELSMDAEMKQDVDTPRELLDVPEYSGESSRSKRAASPRPHGKRKRRQSTESRDPSGPPTHVLWTRAFPKISSSALESVSSHRNAGFFAKAVDEKHVPGYRNTIYCPQDLQSIRKAITAGNKAAVAAAPADQTQSSVWLPISDDLKYPKGIVNYAQLEKELMRMFANAIMFNADPARGLGPKFEIKREVIVGAKDAGYVTGEDSMTSDTKAMYIDVEKVVGDLRAAERRSEEGREVEKDRDDDEDGEGDGGRAEGGRGDEGGSVAKRRRKA